MKDSNLNNIYNLKNKVVVITGSCGQLGSSLCTLFSNIGCTVIGIDYSIEAKINNVDYDVINDLNKLKNLYDEGSHGIIGIGSNRKRVSISQEIFNLIPHFSWMSLLSKYAIISPDVSIGEGTVVISGSQINAGSVIGKHCIINSKSSIDHDNIIGNFVNISPMVVTGGSVKVGSNSDIGIGSTIKNNIDIQDNVTIGGHSFVNKDCETNSLYYGSPIKKIK